MAKSNAVLNPNLGLFLGRAKLGVPLRGLQDGLNFRVLQGKLSNLTLGWTRFGAWTLNGPLMLIEDFFLRDGTEKLVFATTLDIYEYDSGSEEVAFLSPRYATGTAAASGTAVTGIGTTWSTNAKAGDEIHFGNAAQRDPDAVWYEIDEVVNNTSITLTASAGTIADGVYTIRKKFTGEIDNHWISDVFYNASPSNADELWMTNGTDDIVRWDGTATQVEVMSALNFKAKVIAVYANMMIFANLTQAGTEKPADIINSNIGEPQNVTSGISEQFKIHGEFGGIFSMKPLGDALALYSEYTGTLAQFVGGDLVFAFRQAISGQGPIGYRAVADFGDYHQFIGHDGLYMFDGAALREIGNYVWREVLRIQNPASRRTAFHVFNDVFAELIWVLPLTSDAGDSPETAFAEHYLEDVGESGHIPFSKRDFPFTAAGSFTRQNTLTWDELTGQWADMNFRWNDQFFSVAFPLTLVGDIDGKVYSLNSAQSKDGAAMTSFVKFGRRPMFDGRIRGLLTRVYPLALPGTTALTVTAHMADNGEAQATTSDEQSVNFTTTSDYFTIHYRRGRYTEIEFGSDASEPWELSGYDLDIRPGGRR